MTDDMSISNNSILEQSKLKEILEHFSSYSSDMQRTLNL
jgi:hypothetical protein